MVKMSQCRLRERKRSYHLKLEVLMAAWPCLRYSSILYIILHLSVHQCRSTDALSRHDNFTISPRTHIPFLWRVIGRRVIDTERSVRSIKCHRSLIGRIARQPARKSEIFLQIHEQAATALDKSIGGGDDRHSRTYMKRRIERYQLIVDRRLQTEDAD